MAFQHAPPRFASSPSQILQEFCDAVPRHEALKPGMVSLLTTLFVHQGWDPQAQLTFPTGPKPLLDWLSEFNPSPSPQKRFGEWPTDLAEFEALEKANPDMIKNDEWLLAFVVASGASPWDHTDEPMAPALQKALQNQRWQLARQMLSLPGAPSIQDVLDAPLPSALTTHGSTWGSWLLARASGLGALLPNPTTARAFMDTSLGFAELVSRYTPSVEAWELMKPQAVYLFDPSKLSEKDKARIEKAWERRVRNRDVSAQAQAEVCTYLHTGLTKEESPTTLPPSAAIQADLGWKWGKSLLDRSEEKAEQGLGLTFLTSAQDVASGPLTKGTWTVLASKLFSRLRGTGPYQDGVPSVKISHWLIGKSSTSWQEVVSTHRGALAAGLTPDWRPGIPLAAVAAISLLGQDSSPSFESRLKTNPIWATGAVLPHWDDLADWKALLGIDDWVSWSRNLREPMVAFTEASIRSNALSASKSFAVAWGQVLSRFPDFLADAPELQLRLVRALAQQVNFLPMEPVAGGGLMPKSPRGNWGEVLRSIGKTVGLTDYRFNESMPSLESQSVVGRKLLLELALILRRPTWFEGLASAAERGLLDQGDAARLKEFAEACRQRFKKGEKISEISEQTLVQLRAIRVSIGLPAAPQVARAAPRF